MPVYAFLCETCGTFEERRPISQASDPACCPVCEVVASRLYTAPNLRSTPPAMTAARMREEKSAHEPEVIRRETPAESVSAPALHHSHGRPWQISH